MYNLYLVFNKPLIDSSNKYLEQWNFIPVAYMKSLI